MVRLSQRHNCSFNVWPPFFFMYLVICHFFAWMKGKALTKRMCACCYCSGVRPRMSLCWSFTSPCPNYLSILSIATIRTKQTLQMSNDLPIKRYWPNQLNIRIMYGFINGKSKKNKIKFWYKMEFVTNCTSFSISMIEKL